MVAKPTILLLRIFLSLINFFAFFTLATHAQARACKLIINLSRV